MAILGTGIMPGGATGTELQYVTRRAFIPKMIVQLYNSSPLIAALLANAQPAGGGVSSVTVPVQGASFVNFAWTDYSGSFQQPSVQQGAQNAEFNLKVGVVPVPFLGFEALVQKDHAVIPLIEARMNDATNVMVDGMSTALYANFSNAQQIIGLPGAIDDGTNLNLYGNISRSANPFWKSRRLAAGSVAPTRALILQAIMSAVKLGAEFPSFGICGPGTWVNLAGDYIAQETYVITPEQAFDGEGPGPRSAFKALMVAGMPVYMDPYIGQQAGNLGEGTIYLVNSNYMAAYLHQDAAFAFTGFQSTIPNNQLGFVGVVVTALELVSVKPKTMLVETGFTFITI